MNRIISIRYNGCSMVDIILHNLPLYLGTLAWDVKQQVLTMCLLK
ncbi:hypothetical protein A1122_07835 [Yersinia pestis A1122]|nr:hypothetical protein A1122_07835 [Yersinia pestis A1122]EKS43668.1 hypothetical protein INS_19077 [Yersinia pestis INS]